MRSMRFLLPWVAMVCALAPPARGAHLGVYFDLRGTESSARVEPLQGFTFWVMASDVSAGIYGFEFALEVDPQITVTGRGLLASGAFDVGMGDDNWIVGTGACVPAAVAAPMVAYTGMLMVDEDYLRIDLGPSEPSSTGRGPAYLECERPEVLSFDSVSGATLNPENSSWSAVKDLYRD